MRRKIIPLALLCSVAGVQAEPQAQWVSGSFVNVRVAASKTAAVADKLIINTPVSVLAQRDGFCEITWGTQQRGFIACNLLSTKPTTLAEVSIEKLPNGKPNPGYSATRAFWLEPSYARLLAAARFFDTTMLTEKQREIDPPTQAALENGKTMPAKRFPVPEFDAMRALLAKGLIAPKALAAGPRPWNVEDARFIPEWSNESAAPYEWAYHQIKLPAVKPSLFKNASEIGSPKASAEGISAQFGIPWSLRVTKPSYWANYEISGTNMVGAWDIGEVELKLAQPVFTVTVSEKGRIDSVKNLLRKADFFGDSPIVCSGGTHIEWPLEDGVVSNNDETRPELPALLRLTQPLPFKQAKISTKKQALQQPKNLSKEVKFVHASLTTIDLDSDGIDDVALWNGKNERKSYVSDGKYEVNVKIIFVNIQGRWNFLEVDMDDAECVE